MLGMNRLLVADKANDQFKAQLRQIAEQNIAKLKVQRAVSEVATRQPKRAFTVLNLGT